jgi:hypothetical protein
MPAINTIFLMPYPLLIEIGMIAADTASAALFPGADAALCREKLT